MAYDSLTRGDLVWLMTVSPEATLYGLRQFDQR